MNKIKLTLADRLDDLLREKGIQSKDVCEATGITTGNFSKILTGQVTNPQLDTLKKLANYFGVTIDYLVCISDYPTPQRVSVGEQTGLSNGAIENLCKIPQEWTDQYSGDDNSVRLFNDLRNELLEDNAFISIMNDLASVRFRMKESTAFQRFADEAMDALDGELSNTAVLSDANMKVLRAISVYNYYRTKVEAVKSKIDRYLNGYMYHSEQSANTTVKSLERFNQEWAELNKTKGA